MKELDDNLFYITYVIKYEYKESLIKSRPWYVQSIKITIYFKYFTPNDVTNMLVKSHCTFCGHSVSTTWLIKTLFYWFILVHFMLSY